jgi:hypothetical protein
MGLAGKFPWSVRGELAKGSNVAKGSWPFGRSVGVAGLSATHCVAQVAGPGLSAVPVPVLLRFDNPSLRTPGISFAP